jgi:hypothetical protein
MKSKRSGSRPLPMTKADKPEVPWTMPIPAFGRTYYGLGRSAAYDAAKRREIPVMQIGGRLRGLPHVAEAQLSGRLPRDEDTPR